LLQYNSQWFDIQLLAAKIPRSRTHPTAPVTKHILSASQFGKAAACYLRDLVSSGQDKLQLITGSEDLRMEISSVLW